MCNAYCRLADFFILFCFVFLCFFFLFVCLFVFVLSFFFCGVTVYAFV